MKTYLTIISNDDYLNGAIVLYKSLKLHKPSYNFIVALTEGVSAKSEHTLKSNKINTLRLNNSLNLNKEQTINNKSSGFDRYNNTLSKLLIFDLSEFEKIVYLDSDMIVLRNLDHLFEKPHMSAVAAGALIPGKENYLDLNSGLMVIEPQKGLASKILSTLPQVIEGKKVIGDQDLLHFYYPDWKNNKELHLEHSYNLFFDSVKFHIESHGFNMNSESPNEKTIAVVHFIGSKKPWNDNKIKTLLKSFLKGDFYSFKILLSYYRLLKRV